MSIRLSGSMPCQCSVVKRSYRQEPKKGGNTSSISRKFLASPALIRASGNRQVI